MLKLCKYCSAEFEAATGNKLYCTPSCASLARKNSPDRKSYQVEYVSERRRKIKQRAIEYLGGQCRRCGYDRCLAALEFHHRVPDGKDKNIAALHRSWENITKELDKCDLLCSNCHREVHSFKGKVG